MGTADNGARPMTAKRALDFNLGQALSDPGFTPRVRDVRPLLDHVASGDDLAEAAERALLRVGPQAGLIAAERAPEAPPIARYRLTKLVGRLAAEGGGEVLAPFLIARLEDADDRTRRAAANALGKARPPGSAEALAAALARAEEGPTRKALIEALGKAGGEAAVTALSLEIEGIPGSVEAKARLMAERTVAREVAGSIDGTREIEGKTPVVLRCRQGLERILLEELDADLGAHVARRALGGARIEAELTGPLDRLFQARTMLSFAFPLPEIRINREADLAPVIADALTSKAALDLFQRFTTGPIRYRLGWASGGKRRAVVWRAASEVAERSRKAGVDLVNDPTDSLWDVTVFEAVGSIRLELSPRLADPRFTYRKGDVPAASHPTIAAALIRAGGVKASDIVWDPFMGSGLELCERALAGPYQLLIGTDRDVTAIAIARENLAAAGARDPILMTGDATSIALPGRPSLIVTNPPLGRRVERTAELSPMLDRLMARAARSLVKGGRMVWIAPFPDKSDLVALRGGLTIDVAEDVDMGGFTGRLQVLRRPEG
jgi:23S rRNA G2445 N2-methylase RlmL